MTVQLYISSIGILSLYIHYFKVITKSYNYMTSCIGVLKYVYILCYISHFQNITV